MKKNDNFSEKDYVMKNLELTPLTIRILEKYHIQLSDVVLCVVLPRLELQRFPELIQERLSELTIQELHLR